MAHALESNDVVWAPGGYPGSQWPLQIDQSDGVGAFQQFFELHGFETCNSPTQEPGFVKLAIYALAGEFQHVARQLPNGQWTSKLGMLQDIEHALQVLEDARYGTVAILMRRALQVVNRR